MWVDPQGTMPLQHLLGFETLNIQGLLYAFRGYLSYACYPCLGGVRWRQGCTDGTIGGTNVCGISGTDGCGIGGTDV